MSSSAVKSRKSRIAFLNTHPIQYFAPFYAHINRTPDLEAVPIYLTRHGLTETVDHHFGQPVRWDIDLLEGSRPLFVKRANRRALKPGFLSIIAPDVASILLRERFDAVVIHGHGYAANHVAILASRLAGSRLFVRADSHFGIPKSLIKRWLRSFIMPLYFSAFTGALAAGSRNAQYYAMLGFAPKDIYLVPFAVDNDRFVKGGAVSNAERRAIRQGLGITDDRPILLYAGKFQPLKRVQDIVAAAHRLAGEGVDFHLVLAGAGVMEQSLRVQAAAGPAKVHFPGFVQQSALPPLLGSVDAFVIASDIEAWGFVVNEAMCAGLPIIASHECGCTADLVREGVNGHLFSACDVDGLLGAIRLVMTDKEVRTRMGRKSVEIITGWSYDQGVEGLRRALAGTGREKR